MFVCQNCGSQSKPHESPTKVVVETREKQYINHIKRGRKTFKTTTYGTEIVKELSCCSKCVDKLSNP